MTPEIEQQEIGGLKADMKHVLQSLAIIQTQLQNLINNTITRIEVDKKLETVHFRINKIKEEADEERKKYLTKEAFFPYQVVLGIIGTSIITYILSIIFPKLFS